MATNKRAPAAKPGDNLRVVLHDISMSAAVAGVARDVLIAKLAAFADHPNDDQVRTLQRAVHVGYIAGRLAALEQRGATDSDIAAASVVLAKANANAKKAGPLGKRTEAEERFYGAARVFWGSLAFQAKIAPDAGTGKGRAVGGKASAAKRAARVTKTAGGADVVVATSPAVAPGSKGTGTLAGTPVGEQDASKARAHVISVAAALLAFSEKSKLEPPLKRAVKAFHKAAMAAGLPS